MARVYYEAMTPKGRYSGGTEHYMRDAAKRSRGTVIRVTRHSVSETKARREVIEAVRTLVSRIDAGSPGTLDLTAIMKAWRELERIEKGGGR